MVELLVAVAIVAALIGLLIPAIQAAREAARATACRYRLRQIGLAVQGHLGALRMYPTGGNAWWTPPTFVNGRPATGRQQDAGWAFQILPYMEATAAWSPSGGDDKSRILAAVAARHEGYFCPTRRPPQAMTYADPDYLDGIEATHGLIDYAGSNAEGTGLFVNAGTDLNEQPLRPAEVIDGMTKTLAVAEKRLNVRLLGSWQQDDNEGYTAGWDEDTIRASRMGPEPDHTGDPDGEDLFGSSHRGSCNAVFADGAVHAIAYDIDDGVFYSLGDIDDGTAHPGADF